MIVADSMKRTIVSRPTVPYQATFCESCGNVMRYAALSGSQCFSLTCDSPLCEFVVVAEPIQKQRCFNCNSPREMYFSAGYTPGCVEWHCSQCGSSHAERWAIVS